MKSTMWKGALIGALLLSARSQAGEFTIDYRLGATDLSVDGDRLSSGQDVSDALMSMGLSLSYKWTRGPFLEFGLAKSFSPFPIFDWNDVGHASLAGGWQFGEDHWHFKPKVGLTRTSLESQHEDFFEGNEPVDEIKDVVPFLEAAFEYRFGGKLGLGGYVRQNFEDFGSTTMYGLSLGWTFD